MTMTGSDTRSREMISGVAFIISITTVMCSLIAINNIHLYSDYQKAKYNAKTFSLMVECQIESVKSREVSKSKQGYQRKSFVTVESNFVIQLIHPLNNTKKYFEVSSVPINLFNSVINTSYPCYIDPSNSDRVPLDSPADAEKAQHELIWGLLIPSLVAIPGLLIAIVICLNRSIDKVQSVISSRPRGFFRVRTHPITNT